MNKFLLFKFKNYYPDGGWSDFVGGFPTLGDAMLKLREYDEYNYDLFQIVDLNTMTIVSEGEYQNE